MINPLTLFTLLNTINTGVRVLDGLFGTISDAVNGQTAQNFSDLIDSTNSTSSLNVNPQAGIVDPLQSNGAGSLVNLDANPITDETVDAINQIINGDSSDVESLVQTDQDGKLDDPFGIKAAELNGSPISATPVQTPIDATNVDETIDDSDLTTGIIQPEAIKKPENNQHSEIKNVSQHKILRMAEKTEGDAVDNLQNNILGKNDKFILNKLHDNVPQVDREKIADRISNNISNNPLHTAIAAHDLDAARIDSIRNLRAKEDIKEKFAEAESYKIVNVVKKDNVLDVRLEPAQLGKLQIKIDFLDGKANISVLADRPETLDLIQKDSKEIQKILADNGIKADSNSLSFNLRGQQQQGANDFNFFSGRPLSLRVEEQISRIASNDNSGMQGYYYNNASTNGALNILV